MRPGAAEGWRGQWGRSTIKQTARGASQNRSEALALGPRGVASRAAGRGRKAGRLEGAALAG